MRVSWRRLAAFAVDYLVLACYIGLLYLVGRSASLTWVQTPWQAHLLGFTALTLPVTLYFALLETRRGATLGKQVLGLRVTNHRGDPLPLNRSYLRSAVKFAPWELSHTALYRVGAGSEPLATWQAVLFSLSLLGAALYLFELFAPPQRPLYDRASGARVSSYSTHFARSVS